MARCFTLQLSQEELNVVASVVDSSLNVQQSLAETDREKAVGALRGAQVEKDKHYPENVVLKRDIPLTPLEKRKKKKTSNWPSAQEDRDKLKRRTAERRAQGIPSPFGRVSVSGMEYLPSPGEKIVLAKVKSQVAQLVGAAPETLSSPAAVVSMIKAGVADRRLHTQDGVGISISIRDDTKPIEIKFGGGLIVAPDLLEAGEAVAFDRRHAHREPVGDFRRTLFFAHGDAGSLIDGM